MNLKTRLNAVLGLSAIVSLLVAGIAIHIQLRRQAVSEVRREAELHMEAATALRGFTARHVRPLLNKDPAVFQVESVPSFAANTAMRELNRRYPGARYREVALNPTNPDNLASGIYAEIVQQLRREQVDSVQRETSESGQPMLYIAKPLRVNDASCLACHGTPEAAPPAMRAIYGDAHGFGWQLNETVGAQVVALPMTLPLQRAQQALGNFLAGAFAVVLTVVLALNAMLRRTLLNPIASHQGELHRQAREDELTGAINRRGFFEEAQPALERARASGEAVSVAMFDVDHFKRINDEHGHAAGDQVLRELVQRLRHRVRASDLLGRLGGDEFALLLPHTSLEAARELAGALHARLQAGRYPHAAAVGISMGLAQWDGQETVESLLARADTALYDAKRSGRGRVCG